MKHVASWREIAQSFPCPVCNAAPGEKCRTNNGTPKYETHASRWAPADRCHKCGTRLPAEAEPWELCDRCALVRALEIERASVYRRRD